MTGEHYTESTSAALRRVEQERDELAEVLAEVRAAAGMDDDQDRHVRLADRVRQIRDGRAEAIDHFVQVVGERDRARTELDAVRTARDTLDRQLVAARTEIADLDRQVKLCPRCGIELNADLSGGTPALASWIVARDGGRDCVSCDQEIRRGEAYELMSGADQLSHVHCPDPTEEHETA